MMFRLIVYTMIICFTVAPRKKGTARYQNNPSATRVACHLSVPHLSRDLGYSSVSLSSADFERPGLPPQNNLNSLSARSSIDEGYGTDQHLIALRRRSLLLTLLKISTASRTAGLMVLFQRRKGNMMRMMRVGNFGRHNPVVL